MPITYIVIQENTQALYFQSALYCAKSALTCVKEAVHSASESRTYDEPLTKTSRMPRTTLTATEPLPTAVNR